MNAETIAMTLGARKAGGGWIARCPSHDDHEPSLSIRDADDGKVLLHCHAGCDQERVIATLRSRGLWTESGRRLTTRFARSVPKRTEADRDEVKRTEAALAIWQAAMPAGGTPVEMYLVSRELHLPPPPAVEFATLEWVDWFNNRRLLEPIGNIPPAPSHANPVGYQAGDYAACISNHSPYGTTDRIIGR